MFSEKYVTQLWETYRFQQCVPLLGGHPGPWWGGGEGEGVSVASTIATNKRLHLSPLLRLRERVS